MEHRTLPAPPGMVSRDLYDQLLDKYHELALRVATPAPLVLPPTMTVGTMAAPADFELQIEPDLPPGVVLAAMRRISPTSDKAYEANWRYWAANKEKAAAHPEAFADDILAGVNAS